MGREMHRAATSEGSRFPLWLRTGFGIATTRPVMGIFFATSSLTHLQPKQFFGLAFWVGLSMNIVIVEFWLRSRNAFAGA